MNFTSSNMRIGLYDRRRPRVEVCIVVVLEEVFPFFPSS